MRAAGYCIDGIVLMTWLTLSEKELFSFGIPGGKSISEFLDFSTIGFMLGSKDMNCSFTGDSF